MATPAVASPPALWRARMQEDDDDAGEAGADGIVGSCRGGNKISPLAFSPTACRPLPLPTSGAETGAGARVVPQFATNTRFYLHRIVVAFARAKNGTVVDREVEEAVTTTVSSPQGQSLAPNSPQNRMLRRLWCCPRAPSPPCVSWPLISLISSRSLGVTPVPSTTPQKMLQASKQSSRSFAALVYVDVFPCKACGEVLARPQQLELHQAMKRSLSSLDSSI
jgi:hypothetical protein